MFRKLIAALCLSALLACPADAVTGTRRVLLSGGVPTWVKPGANTDNNFAAGQYYGCSLASCFSVARASPKTNLLPSSASGFPYLTVANNIAMITPGLGWLIEESRLNQLLNSTVPATQTTASLGTGTYTLWDNGSGSATMSSGTGTGCGTGVATNGSPVQFTITIAGTCTVTVTGSLNAFQLEAGSFGTSLIVTAAATATRAADAITILGMFDATLRGVQGAVYFETSLLLSNTAGINSRFIGDNGGTELIGRGAGASMVLVSYNGSVQLTDGSPVNWTSLRKSAVRWTPAPARSLVLAGGSISSDANAKNVQTTYYLGATNGNAECVDGYVARVTTSNIAPSDVVFQGNTQ